MLIQHYKHDADGLCHRLVTPLLVDSVLDGLDPPDIAKTTRVFKEAGWAIRRHELSLGDAIGRGEFGGTFFLFIWSNYLFSTKVQKTIKFLSILYGKCCRAVINCLRTGEICQQITITRTSYLAETSLWQPNSGSTIFYRCLNWMVSKRKSCR